MQTTDQLPRIFQANLSRLFERVIQPAMQALPDRSPPQSGEAASIEEFLARAASRVDDHTANEAAKAFTLTLAAVFERQLSIWARAIHLGGSAGMRKPRGFRCVLAVCAKRAGIDLEQSGLGAELILMFMVANVVRHGEGPSWEKLKATAPTLWNETSDDDRDLLAGPRVPSEHLRVGMGDLVRYVRATTRFWGLADPLPMAVVDPHGWVPAPNA